MGARILSFLLSLAMAQGALAPIIPEEASVWPTAEWTEDAQPQENEAIEEEGALAEPEEGELLEELPEAGLEEETSQPEEAMEAFILEKESSEGPSNQELMDAFLGQKFDQVGRQTARRSLSLPKNTNLTETEFAIEQYLRSMVVEIANGTRTYAVLEVDLTAFGCTYGDIRPYEIFQTLRKDCTYEMYWWGWKRGFSTNTSGTVFKLYLLVDEQFAAAGQAENSRFTTDPTAILTALSAIENAQTILSGYANKTDLEKLRGYVSELESLSGYNYEAASQGNSYAVNSPWELVYVFDGDPATKVVCEGYAKAYEYLCNRTAFSSSLINCYCVSGHVAWQGGGGGGHMWNLVTMDDGNNYLVDVTNCFGSYARFLLYAVSGSVEGG